MRYALRQARRPPGAGARRGRPHARHGLPARHPAHPQAAPGAPADPAASPRPCRGPIASLARRDPPRPGGDPDRAAVRARGRHHPHRVPGAAGAEVGAAGRAAQAARHAQRARLHAHQAPGQPARRATWPRHGVKADRIHGNRSQAQRTQALAGFKDGRFQVLVATDIAARGIDIDALSHVVNFDVPGMPDDYIHRVGRTARAEAVGDALHAGLAGRGGRSARHRARGRHSRFTRVAAPRASTTPSGRPTSSRSRWPSASRRSAPARRRIASAPAPTPSAAPPTAPVPPSSPAAASSPGSGLTFPDIPVRNVGLRPDPEAVERRPPRVARARPGQGQAREDVADHRAQGEAVAREAGGDQQSARCRAPGPGWAGRPA